MMMQLANTVFFAHRHGIAIWFRPEVKLPTEVALAFLLSLGLTGLLTHLLVRRAAK